MTHCTTNVLLMEHQTIHIASTPNCYNAKSRGSGLVGLNSFDGCVISMQLLTSHIISAWNSVVPPTTCYYQYRMQMLYVKTEDM